MNLSKFNRVIIHFTPWSLSSMLLLAICFVGCNKQPFKKDDPYIDGTVIGKETCNQDVSKDYWLIDFALPPNSPAIGDTIELNGIIYPNVVMTKELATVLKIVGLPVVIEVNERTEQKLTSGCSIGNPEIYFLREISILSQGERR